MADKKDAFVTLEQAKELVALLEKDDTDGANNLVRDIAEPIKQEIFEEVGKLTRELHDAINNFQFDQKTQSLIDTDLPYAEEGLEYVIRITEEAATKTMDLVDEVHPLAEDLIQKVDKISPAWQKLMKKEITVQDFVKFCHDINLHFTHVEEHAHTVGRLLNEIIIAQGFQDLSGQVLRRTIDLVHDVQDSLVNLLKIFSNMEEQTSKNDKKEQIHEEKIGAEGPVVNPEKRSDVVKNQDEVDDLLSSLGF